MDANKVEVFLATNKKYFDATKLVMIKEKLLAANESKEMVLSATEFKDPTTMLLISIFLGEFGVDRFMLKDTGIGILKLCTGGLCGILWLIDVFKIQAKTKELNFNNLLQILM